MGKFSGFLRFFLAAVFLWAGIAKGLNPEFFLQTLRGYTWDVSDELLLFAVFWIPWLELFLGGSFLFQRLSAAAAMVSIVLLFAFSAVIAIAWGSGQSTACGCFGFQWDLHPFWLLLRNATLMLFSGMVYLQYKD